MYKAVTKDQLVALLGGQCSPMRGRDGYIIGPDLAGRICHIATHFTLAEAEKAAAEKNKRDQLGA